MEQVTDIPTVDAGPRAPPISTPLNFTTVQGNLPIVLVNPSTLESVINRFIIF
jgi:hypothetical protein